MEDSFYIKYIFLFALISFILSIIIYNKNYGFEFSGVKLGSTNAFERNPWIISNPLIIVILITIFYVFLGYAFALSLKSNETSYAILIGAIGFIILLTPIVLNLIPDNEKCIRLCNFISLVLVFTLCVIIKNDTIIYYILPLLVWFLYLTFIDLYYMNFKLRNF